MKATLSSNTSKSSRAAKISQAVSARGHPGRSSLETPNASAEIHAVDESNPLRPGWPRAGIGRPSLMRLGIWRSAIRGLTPLLLVTFSLLLPIVQSSAQTASNSLQLENNGRLLRLRYSLADTNGVFFLLQSGQVTNLLGAGQVLASGAAASNRTGVFDLPRPTNSTTFFGLLQDRSASASPANLTPNNDGEQTDPNPAEISLRSPDLPLVLPANTSFKLTLEIDNLGGGIVATNGQLALTLVQASGVPFGSAYTLSPATLTVTNGFVQTALTIKTTASLANAFLAGVFTPRSSAVAPQGLSSFSPAGPTSTKKVERKVTYPEYADPDTSKWLHPLFTPVPLSGTFGEWPGHKDIHWGVDFFAGLNTPVRAAKRGVVVHIGQYCGEDQIVEVYHGNGYITRYLHIDPKEGLKAGDILGAGDVLGSVGDFRPCVPVHLHFEMRRTAKADTLNQGANWTKIYEDWEPGDPTPGSPVNPIQDAFTFSPGLVFNDSDKPGVEAVFLRATHPARNPPVWMNESFPTKELSYGPNPAKLYVELQVVDNQTTSSGLQYLTPKRITFTPDLGAELKIVYGTDEASIRALDPRRDKGGTGGTSPGYALLPDFEAAGALYRDYRYKYWFEWDTSPYATAPAGPRGFTVLSEDFAGKSNSQKFSFGPRFMYGGQAVTVGESGTSVNVPVKFSFGPLPNGPFFASGIDVCQCSVSVTPAVDWDVQFLPTSVQTSPFSDRLSFHIFGDDQTTPVTLQVKPKNTQASSGMLTLKATSFVLPNIHDGVTIQLTAQPTKEPIPIPAMVKIPAGTFVMGSPTTEKERWDNEGPQHTVTLTKDFYMSKYEVTQKEYLAVMGNNPSYFTTKDWNGKAINPDLNRPVEQVSWNDAMDYCAKLTASEKAAGRLPAGWVYRLPTEAEWEYACRAGTSTVFHYGNDLRSGMANFDGGYEYVGGTGTVRNPTGTYLARTTTVGSYAPNAFGLYDMHGNVWEWCLDWYGNYPSGSVTDPRGPSTGSYRVFRGGSWVNYARFCRSALRSFNWPDGRDDVLGFRPVLVPGQ